MSYAGTLPIILRWARWWGGVVLVGKLGPPEFLVKLAKQGLRSDTGSQVMPDLIFPNKQAFVQHTIFWRHNIVFTFMELYLIMLALYYFIS